MNFFTWRRTRRMVNNLLHEARHARHMTSDIAAPALVEDVRRTEDELLSAWKKRNEPDMDAAADRLVAAVGRLYPPRTYPRWRENIEILVVAVSVAMAFRTFFVQPFKIPTGSMQPTLYGITLNPPSPDKIMDAFPVSLFSTAVFGRMPVKIRAPVGGVVTLSGRMLQQEMIMGKSWRGGLRIRQMDSPYVAQMLFIGDYAMPIPVEFELLVKNGDVAMAGDVLARGVIKIGDHIFVNKVKYNFRKPRRGDIIVFDTDRIDHPDIRKNNFYIKRLVGLPNEEIRIEPPYLVVDGRRVTEPAPFERLLHDPEYIGYQLTQAPTRSRLSGAASSIRVGPHEFLPFGDNTAHSLDGRYFGPVKEASLVGPAFMVYWPFSKRWGLTR